MSEKTIEKVVVIGGGPAGLAASLYIARATLAPLVFAGSPPGGQLTLTTDVENYPGFESIMGPELIQTFRKHTMKFGTRIADKNIVRVDFSKRPFSLFIVDSAGEEEILAESVIIATGAKALWLGLESETRLRGKGVSACATCDGFFFKNKDVAVVGGGDTALEEALTLTNFATKVYLIHRRDSFRASKIMQERVKSHPKIEIIWNTSIEEIIGEQRVEGIRLKTVESVKIGSQSELARTDNQFQPISILNVSGVFVAIGHKPDTDIYKGQVAMDEKGYIITSVENAIRSVGIGNQLESVQTENRKRKTDFNLNYRTMTSVEGVFAAGDNVDYVYRQAATAVGMGVEAAIDVEKWLELAKNDRV